MSLGLDIAWLAETYEAGLGADRRPEWPPHPARAFCALVASAEPGGPADDALRWLEEQPPPTVLASPAETATFGAFVPTNARPEGKGGNQTYPGRTNGWRTWARVLPARPVARVLWPTSAPDLVVAHLDDLARRVAYVGRAASPVALRFAGEPTPLEGLDRWEPRTAGPRRLRVPRPGYLDALRRAFDGGEAAWGVPPATIPYGADGLPAPPGVATALPFAYPDLVTLAFQRGVALDGRHVAAVAGALRAAVLERLGQPLDDDPWEPFGEERLALVHGHQPGADRRRQCAFLALPFVGHRHATGDLLGVGIALSPQLDADLRRAILRLCGLDRTEGPRLARLHVGGLATVELGPADGRRTVQPERWAAPARRWASALPMVLDWWPKRSRPVVQIVAEGIAVAGDVLPASVEVLSGSLVGGAPFLAGRDRRRRDGEPNRPWAHVAVTFPEPVAGPVLLGHLRHLGLGLCVPLEGRDG